MKILLLIERCFYVRDGVLQQIGETLKSFRSYASASSCRKEIITFNIVGLGCTLSYDDTLDRYTLTRPNGSKVELEIQESLVAS